MPNNSQSARTGSLRIEWHTDLREIRKLRDPWLALQARVAQRTVYCDHDWIVGWYECYAGTKYTDFGQPLVGAAWENDQLVGVAPLTSARSKFARVPVQSLGFAGFNLQAGEFLAPEDRPDIVAGLLASLTEKGNKWDLFSITGLQPDWPLTKALVEALRFLGLRAEMMEDDPFAIADFSAGYQPYIMARTGHFRQNLKRYGRKLTEAGGWSIEKLGSQPTAEQVKSFLQRLIAIADEGWRARQRGLQEEKNHQPFYVSILESFGPRGLLDVQIMKIGGQDAAYCLGLIERNTFFHVLMGFNDSFRNLSPGAFLLQEVFKDLTQRGIHSVLSHGDYDYKKHWASAFIPQTKLLVFNRSLKARLSYFAKFHLQKKLPWIQKLVSTPAAAPQVEASS